MVRRYWVDEKMLKQRLHGGTYEPLSRKEFFDKYHTDEYLKVKYVGKNKPETPEQYLDKNNRIFKPTDKFSIPLLKKRLGEQEKDVDSYMETILGWIEMEEGKDYKDWGQRLKYFTNQYLWGKQQEQFKKYVKNL